MLASNARGTMAVLRRLTHEDRIRIHALMREDPKPNGGVWYWPTAESVALERELTGVADQTKARLKLLKETKSILRDSNKTLSNIIRNSRRK
jgi:hypothetical protein